METVGARVKIERNVQRNTFDRSGINSECDSSCYLIGAGHSHDPYVKNNAMSWAGISKKIKNKKITIGRATRSKVPYSHTPIS